MLSADLLLKTAYLLYLPVAIRHGPKTCAQREAKAF
jgi:hypothetical protein